MDNDIVVGRTNAEPKMYLESIVDPDNNGNGNDVVNRGYDFRLKLNPGKWKEGKNGTIRITFRNVMHTVADAHFPFYSTIDLQMVSEKKSYTAAGDPLFFIRSGTTIDFLLRVISMRDVRQVLPMHKLYVKT